MARDQEAIIAGHACPKCKARKGQPCVYLTPPGYTGYFATEGGRVRAARYGKPMVSTHLERRWRYYDAQDQRRKQNELAAAKAAVPPWLTSLRAFDKDENERMRTWLRANWRLFRLRREEE